MNRLLTLIMVTGLAGLLASCGSTVTSSTQPANANYTYSMVVSPTLFTLNSGDWAPLSASVDVSFENQTPKPDAPQPTTKFYSSDPRITISPAGVVCAGLWDSLYTTCTKTSTLPTGYVGITAYSDARNVSATAFLSVHPRAATIGLSADASPLNSTFWPGSAEPWPSLTNSSGVVTGPANCVSQNNQVQYIAQPTDITGSPISSCSLAVTAGCVNNNDYTWSVADSNVASVSSYGFVVARNPGVTSVYATLNGTTSAPAAFATCPPSSIVLASSAFANGIPVSPYSTADLDTLNKGSGVYFTASLLDADGSPLPAKGSQATVPLNFITSDPLTGTFGTVLPLTSKLTANTSGRLSVMVSCDPSTCNNAVPNFTIPINAAPVVTGEAAGFGYPVYSNVIGVTIQGTTGSTVLVTGTLLSDGVTPAHRLEAYDSESLANTRVVELANTPNSLVVAPNGATAYIGSSAGLVVVNLSTFTPTLQTYPIVGGLSTDVITGQVLGVSPDSRYVLLSDQTSGYVFLIDTTGTKSATRYSIPGIDAVTFAADDSQFWIGGTSGVYLYTTDTFIQISSVISSDAGLSTDVKALAWTPDGQSYFASGATLVGAVSTPSLVNYSTAAAPPPGCPNQTAKSLSLTPATTGPVNLDATTIEGVPYVVGLSGTTWLNYSVSTTAQVTLPPVAPVAPLTPAEGNVCLSTVSVAAPAVTASTLACTPRQVTFSPTLQEAFVTGVVDTNAPGGGTACATPEAILHGYNVASPAEITLAASKAFVPLSGGVLNDGRYLYVGSFDSTNGAVLHRFDVSADTPTPGAEDASTLVPLVPSFVAVVPK